MYTPLYVYTHVPRCLSTYIHTSRAAKCRGLFPSMSSAPTSAHADRSTATTSECPRTAAQCRASMRLFMLAYKREGEGVVVPLEYCQVCVQGCQMFDVCMYAWRHHPPPLLVYSRTQSLTSPALGGTSWVPGCQMFMCVFMWCVCM